MRRPSGERQIRSVTNAISRPFQANSHGHEPLRRWLAATVVVGRPARTPTGGCRSARRCGRPRRASPRRGRSGRSARRSARCCSVQAGAHLDLPADAERVDALIAGRGRRLRPHAPASRSRPCRVVSRATAWRVARSPTSSRRPSPSRSAAARTSAAERRAGERRERAPGRREQHGRRAGPADDQVDGAVVVEVGGDEARAAGGGAGPGRRAVRVHARSPRVSTAIDAVDAERRPDRRWRRRWLRAATMAPTGPACGHRVRVEGAAAQVQEHVDAAGVVEERGVGHALAVEVGPGEAAHARHAGERLLHGEGAVAVVAQHAAAARRPAPARRRDRRRCRRRRPRRRRPARAVIDAGSVVARGDVGEAAVRALAQERDAGAEARTRSVR